MPKKGFMEGPKYTVTIQVPPYLKMLIEDYISKNRIPLKQFGNEAFCQRLGIDIDKVIRKDAQGLEAYKKGVASEGTT